MSYGAYDGDNDCDNKGVPMQQQRRQYGLWKSRLSSRMVAESSGLLDVQWAGDGETLVWLERRDGRGVLVVRRPGDAPQVINDALDVGGGVGYGGGAFCVNGDRLYFAADDGRLYCVGLERGLPEPITPEWGSAASPAVSPDGNLVAYVHHHDGDDRIAVVDTDGERWPTIVGEGADFYMQPSWHPEGDRLVWTSWDHPNMPWNQSRIESTSIRVDDGQPIAGDHSVIAADDDVAVQQPRFSPDGSQLAYLTDRSGHWQICVASDDGQSRRIISQSGREYGGPAWVQGLRYFDWSPDGESMMAVSSRRGISKLETIDLESELATTEHFQSYTDLNQLSVSSTGRVAAIASSSSRPPRIVSVDDNGDQSVETYSSSERLHEDELSTVRPVSWSVDDDGPVDEVHGLLYPPTNPRFTGADKPPAIIMIHGGPTSQRVATWEPRNQFFATRGWTVLDVNYRGSTGYGRDYMEALFGNWGIVDVEDAVGAAQFLVDEGLADEERIVIMGGSAGGYTVLQSLVRHPGTFSAGVSMYGVSNLFELQRGTHKFEERYCDSLVGPLPEHSDLYRERSPLFSADAIEDDLALYHGSEDKVVPPEQTEMIAESLQRRGVPHLHHVYEGEGHGWRRADTVDHFLGSVQDFLTEHVIYS